MGTPPPPPFTPPPPASSPWPPPSTPSNPPGRRVPRAAWLVVGGLTALLIFGAALAPDDDSPTARAVSTAPPAAPSTTVDEDAVAESVAIRMIAAQVNPDIGVAYSTNRAVTAKLFADIGDRACGAAAGFDDGMAFAAGMVSVWDTFDSETQEFYGGSTDTWAALVGILLGWRCPDQSDRLFS